jgi:type IV pilus assembly protein PilX
MTFHSSGMTSSTPSGALRAQRGAALVVSLIILLLMTIIGVSSMQTTTLEERMAGNLRDQNLAFQSAEAALIEGEKYLENTLLIVTDGSAGLHARNAAPDVFDPDTWANDAKSVAAPVSLNEDQNARYFIEKIGDVSKATGKDLTFDPGGNKVKGGDITGYRVVAIGEGASGNSQAILSSYYGKKEFQ